MRINHVNNYQLRNNLIICIYIYISYSFASFWLRGWGERRCQAMSLPWRFLFLVLVGALMCAADLKKYDLQKNITCSQVSCTFTNTSELRPLHWTSHCWRKENEKLVNEFRICTLAEGTNVQMLHSSISEGRVETSETRELPSSVRFQPVTTGTFSVWTLLFCFFLKSCWSYVSVLSADSPG